MSRRRKLIRMGNSCRWQHKPGAGMKRRPRVEELEPRLALAVAVQGDVLVVTGTSGADGIRIERAGGVLSVSLNGRQAGRFALSSLQRIEIDAQAGADTITVSSSVTTPVLVQ